MAFHTGLDVSFDNVERNMGESSEKYIAQKFV
jgi:hypothetical protein